MEETAFLRPSEVALQLRLSRAKVYTLINTGVIPAVRIAGSLRVPASVLKDFEEEAKTAPIKAIPALR